MKKLLLMGITGISNWGEEFIAECTEYIINKTNCELSISIMSFETKMSILTKTIYYPLLAISKIDARKEFFQKLTQVAVYIRSKRKFETVIRNTDAIIFSCGSFKYTTQKLWAYYTLAVKIANRYGVPVMFSAMNVQAYDEKDYRCRLLGKIINMPNIRVFTTRDGDCGVNRLRSEYRLKDGVDCQSVGDPAFFITEKYDVKKNSMSTTVGINIIYSSVFLKYGGTLSKRRVIKAYVDLLHKLDSKGIRWELFTNGMARDYRTGVRILNEYGNGKHIIRIPKTQNDLLSIISSYKAIFGARLHACIAAYSLNIPFVGVYWDEKLVHFSEITKTRELFVDDQGFCTNDLVTKLANVYNAGYEYDAIVRDYWKEKTQKCLEKFCEGL